jgi:soluble lytic murein transglycosylase
VARAIVEEPMRQGVSRDLVLAVMRIESGFNNFAESHAGALGLMQIMPQTGETLAREIGIDWTGAETLFDPEINIRMGTTYLAQMFERYGSWDLALAAYNWGPAAIDRRLHRGRALPRRYVAQVRGVLQSPALP